MRNIVRVIPCLLMRMRDWGIVKTIRFQDETYIGCAINAVRVFDAKNVDELLLLDIEATLDGRIPDPEIIAEIADESTMPITVGGGIRKLAHVREVLKSGADKIVINSIATEDPEFIRQAAGRFGSQCIVVSIDVKLDRKGRYEVLTRRGRQPTGLDPLQHARRVQELGAGEILLNSIDRDGTWDGYDLELLRLVSDAVSIPVIACGGAGTVQDFADAVNIGRASAVSAGSFFLYHTRRRGILITYPSRGELQNALGHERVRV